MESAKLSRRSAKGQLTRASKTVLKLLELKRPPVEVYEALKALKIEYVNLSDKHVAYCQLLTDDDLYDEEEKWMEVCWEDRVNLEVAVNEYIIAREDTPLPQSERQRNQDPIDSVDSEKTKGSLNTNDKETQKETQENHASGFKLRKEFLPTFSGDVREFGIFQSDFKHIVEGKCSDRDAITLLRSCLSGKPAELIRGIKNDYKAAWEYLESVYGDPRYVADAITNDLASFDCLEEGEDERFCELVHLVRRSFNTLNEVGRSSDMDNNHVLALIEQKMCQNDRRNWCRDLVKDKKPATLKILLEWMNTEMIARMRSSAPLRNVLQFDDAGGQQVNYVAGLAVGRCSNSSGHRTSCDTAMLPDKCWLCHTSDHWTDQCTAMYVMTPDERLKRVKENHGCFSCLKRAGRNHTSDTCYRRRQCCVMTDGEQCRMSHHSLLHGAANLNGNLVATPTRAVNANRVLYVTMSNPSYRPTHEADECMNSIPTIFRSNQHYAGIIGLENTRAKPTSDTQDDQPVKSQETTQKRLRHVENYAVTFPATPQKQEKLRSIHTKLVVCPPKDPHGPMYGHDIRHTSRSTETKPINVPPVDLTDTYRNEMLRSTKHKYGIIDVCKTKERTMDSKANTSPTTDMCIQEFKTSETKQRRSQCAENIQNNSVFLAPHATIIELDKNCNRCTQDEVPRKPENIDIRHNPVCDTKDGLPAKQGHPGPKAKTRPGWGPKENHHTNHEVVALNDSPAYAVYSKPANEKEDLNRDAFKNSQKLRNNRLCSNRYRKHKDLTPCSHVHSTRAHCKIKREKYSISVKVSRNRRIHMRRMSNVRQNISHTRPITANLKLRSSAIDVLTKINPLPPTLPITTLTINEKGNSI